MIIIAAFINNFLYITWVKKAFNAINICICVLILNAVINLGKSSIKDVFTLIIFIIISLLSILTNISPIIFIITSAILSIILQNIGGTKSILATIAIITPSIIIVIIISKCLNIFKESKYVQSAFYGIRPASTALIFAALISICKISFFNFSKYITLTNIINILNVKGLILAIALFFLMKHTKKHPVFYILTSAIIGIIFNF